MRPIFVLLVACSCSIWRGVAEEPGESDRPNVVMIMIDDMGWSDVAAYRKQQGLDFIPVKTPNIDRLVEGGMMFTDAHSAAVVCAPTRFAMMTGSNPYRNGKLGGTWHIRHPLGLTVNRKHTTVGEVMQAAGYRTAFIGKMHLGGGLGEVTIDALLQQPIPDFPQSYGFDYSLTTHDGIQNSPQMYFENGRFRRVNPDNLAKLDQTGTAEDVTEFPEDVIDSETPNGYATFYDGFNDPNFAHSQNGIINTDHVVAFIQNHQKNHEDQPFMVYYCPPQMHTPHAAPIDFEPDPETGLPASPPNAPVRGNADYPEARIADTIAELDLHVAKILAALEDPDGDPETDDSVMKNTLIMFTSDNGGLASSDVFAHHQIPGHRSTGKLRGAKGEQYEGGHRVPFIAHWGDGTKEGSKIEPGTVNDALIANHDWVATMYAMTGQEVPEDQAMDSVNIMPLFMQEQPKARDFVILQAQEKGDSHPYMIRVGDYVLNMSSDVVNAKPKHDETLAAGELYNLKDDLTQETNLLDPATYENGEVPAVMLDRAGIMLELYKGHNHADDPRSTPAYQLP